MKLPPRFSLHIDGTLWRIRQRATVQPDLLPYLLGRMLSGEELADEALASFGLRVEVEADTDDGDDLEL